MPHRLRERLQPEGGGLVCPHRPGMMFPGFQVPVDDPLPLCLVQRIGDLDGDLERLIERQRTFLQPLGERLALQVLHDQEVDPVLAADVVEGANVRVIEAGDGLGLALEALLQIGIRGDVLGQDFDGDGAIESRASCLVNLTHAPAPIGATMSYGPRCVPASTGIVHSEVVNHSEIVSYSGIINPVQTGVTSLVDFADTARAEGGLDLVAAECGAGMRGHASGYRHPFLQLFYPMEDEDNSIGRAEFALHH